MHCLTTPGPEVIACAVTDLIATQGIPATLPDPREHSMSMEEDDTEVTLKRNPKTDGHGKLCNRHGCMQSCDASVHV